MMSHFPMKLLPAKVLLTIRSMRWFIPCPTPLQYEPLDRLTPFDSSSQDPLFHHQILPSLKEWRNLASTPRQDHYTILSLAIICLGNNCPSQAHNLVTPLSWAEDTHFGFDSSKLFNQASPDVRATASYIHALVHRYEGAEYGEYGITGYANANFWTKAALQYNQRSTDILLPLNDIQTGILEKARGNKHAEQWCHTHLGHNWDPRALHLLCRDTSLTNFAQDAACCELNMMLQHCLHHAGFDYIPIETHIALASANKISSAHVEAFQTDGFVILRRVMSSYSDVDKPSVSAGIACRLFDSPASCIVQEGMVNLDDSRKRMYILISSTDEVNISELIGTTYYGGGSLGFGDAIVLTKERFLSNRHELAFNIEWMELIACDEKEPQVTFVDSLYGKRGSCPTSVLQWSKGTIHKSI